MNPNIIKLRSRCDRNAILQTKLTENSVKFEGI